jgi:AcrR family transcriptional regulator
MQIEDKPQDRRSRRTRRQLKEALFALILEKGYDAVTIEDITDRADLGRTTFYLHYHDKEELLLESIDSIAAELLARMPLPDARATRADDDAFVQQAISITFQHANENAQLYRVILRGEGASLVSGRLHRIISQIAQEFVQRRIELGLLPPSQQVPVDVFANSFAGSPLALITWWLESGSAYPPGEMAVMFRKLFFQGGRSALTA